MQRAHRADFNVLLFYLMFFTLFHSAVSLPPVLIIIVRLIIVSVAFATT